MWDYGHLPNQAGSSTLVRTPLTKDLEKLDLFKSIRLQI